MTKKTFTVLVTLTLLMAGTALAIKVGYNYDSDANFSQYKTYKWVDIPKGEQIDDLTAKDLRNAINAQLQAKGLREVQSDDADLYVGFQLSVSHEKQLNVYNSGWGYGPGWGGRWYGGWGGGMSTGMSTGTTSTIEVGSFDFDMYDVKAKRLVWRGVATGTIKTYKKPEKRRKAFAKGAKKLLKNFPPKLKK